ncbi:MAG: hypothetical protein IT386_17270 [Deltaproteobacteria bacterium]|nr:hypothetical protein [Deltaproteobacteria bacterium]
MAVRMAGRGVAAGFVALVALTGCNAQKALWQAGIPGVKTPLMVTRTVPIAGYLEVDLAGSGLHLDTFTPATADCAEVMRVETTVDYVASGPYGNFQRGDATCEAVGLGSLREWRDRRPSQTNVVMQPRAQAAFAVWHRDPDQIFLRGRFPLGGLLGFTGLDDTIAVVPNTPECQQPIHDGVATMQYSQNGPNPLVLLSGSGECPIRALVQPLPGSEVRRW